MQDDSRLILMKLRHHLLIVVPLLLGPIVVGCGVSIEETRGKQQQGMEEFFDRALVRLSRQGNEVSVVSDMSFMSFQVAGQAGLVTSFRIGEGGSFSIPDEHSFRKFTVLAIEEQGIRLAYESTFDHRTFGPNRISVDRGVVYLMYRDREDSAKLE